MRNSVKDQVLKYLLQHTGKTVFLDDMAGALGLDQRQIQNCMYQVKGQQPDLFKVMIRGRVWHINGTENVSDPAEPITIPVPVPDGQARMVDEPRLFDEIGTTKNGDVIVADKQNRLYKLVDL